MHAKIYHSVTRALSWCLIISLLLQSLACSNRQFIIKEPDDIAEKLEKMEEVTITTSDSKDYNLCHPNYYHLEMDTLITNIETEFDSKLHIYKTERIGLNNIVELRVKKTDYSAFAIGTILAAAGIYILISTIYEAEGLGKLTRKHE